MGMENKKVCMIAYTNYLSDARVRLEAETLANDSGFAVTVLVLRDGNISPTIYKRDGVEVVELNIGKYQGKNIFKYGMSYLQFMFLAFLKCNSLLLFKKYDIFHVHNMPDFLIFAATLPRILKKKIILDIHDSIPETYGAKYDDAEHRFLFKLLCWEELICCKFATKIICVNHVQKDVLIERGIPEEKITVSMNVPDHKKFIAILMKQGESKSLNKFKLVYHGTLTKRLGVDFTIEAVAKLIDKIPGLEFHVLGHGDDIEEYIQLSKDLGVDNIVHFNKQFIPLEDLIGIVSGMDLGVISNRKNKATDLMLPVKMLEYIFLEIPVIAPRLKTIEHYFSEGMVSYFEPENVDSLANTIYKLWSSESERKKQAMKAKDFLNIYGWEKHCIDLINLYKGI